MGYEFFYEGSTGSLDPGYGDAFIGYRVPAGHLGATTSVQTANQVKEVTNLLNQGIKNVEVSMINPDVFEMIPKESLKEVNRLAKLTGSDTTLHAPVVDPSGFTQQGWNETNRESAERQFTDVMKRGYDLNPKGGMPVTIHASAVPGTEYIPMKDPVTGEMKEIPQKMVAVNQETGEFIPLIREKRYYPDKIAKYPQGKMYEPEEELKIANTSYWDNKLSQLVFYKDRGDELIDTNEPIVRNQLANLRGKAIKPEDLTQTQRNALNSLNNAEVYLENTHQVLNSLFNQAYKFSNKQGKEVLQKAADQFKKGMQAYGDPKSPTYGNAKTYSDALQQLINNMTVITTRQGRHLTPQIYKPVEDFTKDKASETLGNVAFNTYKKFGEKSPIISIENPPYGSALARAEDLKQLIDKSRDKFVKKLVKEKGMSTGDAKKAAEKMIGATWDTSHISMMRKQGFGKDKLVDQAKIIAPYVKHVHLNDNFGSTHTDLPPGMADVPFKKILKEFDKAGVEAKKIFEGGNFFQHFQTSPHPFVLDALGSPMYSAQTTPTWNQGLYGFGNYFTGYGPILPEQHFSTYGAGFSGMPAELGGQVQGRQSRFAGSPNA